MNIITQIILLAYAIYMTYFGLSKANKLLYMKAQHECDKEDIECLKHKIKHLTERLNDELDKYDVELRDIRGSIERTAFNIRKEMRGDK